MVAGIVAGDECFFGGCMVLTGLEPSSNFFSFLCLLSVHVDRSSQLNHPKERDGREIISLKI
jgi:hypothetical protein